VPSKKSSNSRQMFSRSFASSIKSPQDVAADIARRANPTRQTIRRSPACSGEEHYTYKHDGFRVFEHSQGNYAQNLVKDYEDFIARGNDTTLPYHHAIAAIHHAHTAHSVEILRHRRHIIEQLTTTHNPNPNPNPTLTQQPAPQQPDYTLSRHLLDKMKYALPQHQKTLVVVRPDCCHANFDPANVPPERTFIKKCCEEPSSADTCCCHAGTSSATVQFTNALGECLYVSYFSRKNDFLNTTYRMWNNPSDDERVPHSPSDEVSESEIFPARCDSKFQNEIDAATTAAAEGFTHMWSNKSYKRRFERRQRRRQQLESGELPKYGLILVILDTEETRACRPHPIAGHDEERRQLYKARYEKIRDAVHAQAIAQGLIAEPQPQPQPQPQQPDRLLYYLMRRKLQHISRATVVLNIERPLSLDTLAIAHGVARAQVTAISALQPHQRLRTVAGSLLALLAIRLCCERTSTIAIVNQHLYDYHDQHYVHNLHHDGIHGILRRASGSHARVNQIAAPYTDSATHPSENISTEQYNYMKQYMTTIFKTPFMVTPELMFGPHSFHKAEYYAGECLKLIGNPSTDDPASAARWANLSAKVQSVRRGELTAYQVLADPGPANDYWVYKIRYTFHLAIQNYLNANSEWLLMNDRPSRHAEGRVLIRCDNGASLFWPRSKETQIRINASRVTQTTLMIRSMYRFLIQASRILSTEFAGVFGYNMRFIKVIISRAKHLATHDGDEASALMFAHFFPCLMTPDVHLDIFVEGYAFQHPDLYVKMSDNVLGEIKKEFRDVIPSRHTGTIDRSTLLNPVKNVFRV
jgi:hypothetical protein